MTPNYTRVRIDLARRSMSNRWNKQWPIRHFSIKLSNNEPKQVGSKKQNKDLVFRKIEL